MQGRSKNKFEKLAHQLFVLRLKDNKSEMPKFDVNLPIAHRPKCDYKGAKCIFMLSRIIGKGSGNGTTSSEVICIREQQKSLDSSKTFELKKRLVVCDATTAVTFTQDRL